MRTVSRICLLTMLAMLLLCGSAWAKLVIKAATANPPGSFHVECLNKFKELVEERSGGDIQVNTFIGGQMGAEQDNVQQCSTGMLHMAILAVNNLTPFSKAVGFLTLPYMFPKIEDAYKLFESPFMDELNETLVKQANVRAASWLVGGYRVLTNSKKPVYTPADLKGLTIRVPKNDIMIATYKAWGVNPVPMAWTEVFNGLQQGVIDGQDNPHVVNASMKFFEVQKYITNIHYLLWTGPFIVSEPWFKTLTPEQQELITTAAKDAAKYEWEWVAKQDQEALQECLAKGMQLDEPKDELTLWAEPARGVWPQFYDSVGGKEMVDKVQQVLAQ